MHIKEETVEEPKEIESVEVDEHKESYENSRYSYDFGD